MKRPERGDVAPSAPNPPLVELLVAMRSKSAMVRETALAACYERFYPVVRTRVFYIVRCIGWLREPAKVAEDVARDVFVGLPEAATRYREEGQAESWLKQVALRAALRKKEALSGLWVTGKKTRGMAGADPRGTGRRTVPIDQEVDKIADCLDAVEREEELIELRRRREALRNSPDPTRRQWDEFLELYVAGYDFKQIGERMGLTEASARNWLCKIRKHLTRPVPPDAKE